MTRLTELNDLKKSCMTDPEEFIRTKSQRYWKIIGELKRETTSDVEEVKIASEIRDFLYERRLGKSKPIFPWIIYLNIIGMCFLSIGLLFSVEEIMMPLMIVSWIFISTFMLVYYQLVSMSRRSQIIYFLLVVGLTVVSDLILWFLDFMDILVFFNQLYVIAAVPCFYLNGRLVGGKIAKIKFDGISRDVFWLFTLKINYESYLLAKPTQRQWIFLCGGLGTVVTSFIGSTLIWIIYQNPWFFLLPILLFAAEILDYLNLGGPLGGAEFNHLRRERRIIKDWKNIVQGN